MAPACVLGRALAVGGAAVVLLWLPVPLPVLSVGAPGGCWLDRLTKAAESGSKRAGARERGGESERFRLWVKGGNALHQGRGRGTAAAIVRLACALCWANALGLPWRAVWLEGQCSCTRRRAAETGVCHCMP